MNEKNWQGLVKVLELRHYDASGNLVSEQKNLLNLLHLDGEEFLLRAAFLGGRDSTIIPDDYYLGLDNRSTVAASDTMDSLLQEPISGGYQRQRVSSNGDFSLNVESGHYLATSPIVAFRSTTAAWGPVNNLFLTDQPDNSGSLISTVVLGSPVNLTTGESVTIRIGLQLKQC